MVQPALFAVMVSLAELWRSYGVKPAAVYRPLPGRDRRRGGRRGALARGRRDAGRPAQPDSISSWSAPGRMASVALSAEQIDALIEPFGEEVALAAVNGPTATVLSGEPEALPELLGQLEAEGIRARADRGRRSPPTPPTSRRCARR